MSEDIHASGAILIDPPLTWEEAGQTERLNLGGSAYDAVLRVVQEQVDVPGGVMLRRHVDAIIPSEMVGWHLTKDIQHLVTQFADGHTFTGHIESTYRGDNSVCRLVVRDGQVVEVKPTWPDEVAVPADRVVALVAFVMGEHEYAVDHCHPTPGVHCASWCTACKLLAGLPSEVLDAAKAKRLADEIATY